MIKPGLRRSYVIVRLTIGLLACAWLVACATESPRQLAPAASEPPAISSPTSQPQSIPSATPVPTRAPSLLKSSPTPIQEGRICSPFPEASQADLIASISNPFNPPPPGSDDPHQGVDLAVQQNGIALAGAPALAVLSGQVAMVTDDRFPYGYALIVETPLDALPPDWLEKGQPSILALPSPAPTLAPNPALSCPSVTPDPPWDETRRSIYLLYAHLQEKAAFQPGDAVECGEIVGRIGQSGNALNPHLHLEARLGPAGARFSSLAHYDNTARPEEMGNYCLWRVSNVFQLIDPLRLLAQLP